MTDISQSLWQEIEKVANHSCFFPTSRGGYSAPGIELKKLREVVRRSRRSNDQNALLWSLYEDVLRIGGESLGGWTKDDLHEWALGEYFGWTEHKAFGRTRLKPNRRSSRLTKTEFTDFLDWFVRKMADNEIVLELPGEQAA